MAIPRPTVRGDSMSYYDSLGNLIHVPLDSPEWERWTADHRSFRYDDPQGGFTARKEARHGYFYRRRSDGKVLKLPKPSSSKRLIFLKHIAWYYWYAFRNLKPFGTVKCYVGANPTPERMEKASNRCVEKLTERGYQGLPGR